MPDRQSRSLADVQRPEFLSSDPHRPGLRPQPLPAALRALRISAIFAQHHPHVELVLLALHLRKKSPTRPRSLPLPRRTVSRAALAHLPPRHIERHAQRRRLLLQLGKPASVFRPVPGIDGAVIQAQPLIRNHQIQIEIDGVPESLASRASAEGIVEAEQPRLGLAPRAMAVARTRTPRETSAVCAPRPARRLLSAPPRHLLENHFASLAISDLRRIHNTRAVFGVDNDPIHQHKHRQREINLQQRLRRGKLKDPAKLVKPIEPAPAQLPQPRLQRIGHRPIASAFAAALAPACARLRHAPSLLPLARGASEPRALPETARCSRVPWPSASTASAISSMESRRTRPSQ